MGRNDGTRIKVDPFKNIEPHVMDRRADSLTFVSLQYSIRNTLKFIEEYNKDLTHEKRLKIFHVFLTTIIRTIALHPELNRFIAGRRYWQRNELSLSFVIKRELKYKSEETFTKIHFSPYESLESVRQKVYDKIHEARSNEGSDAGGEISLFGKFPRWLLMIGLKGVKILEFFGLMPKKMVKTDPLYVSAVIANLGSVNIEGGVLHHTYQYGNSSFFVTINKIHKGVVIDPVTEEMCVEDVIDFGFTLDERVSEGFSLGKAMGDFKKFLQNPEILLAPPDISEDTLNELKLKDLDQDPLYINYQLNKEIQRKKESKNEKDKDKVQEKIIFPSVSLESNPIA